jgi:hypothetical protein
MTESKKAWVEPKLIVLVRSKPEEAVLLGCKVIGEPRGATFGWESCSRADDYFCGSCFEQSSGS